jgi:hypothetical protein
VRDTKKEPTNGRLPKSEALCFGCLVFNFSSRDSVYPTTLKIIDLRRRDDNWNTERLAFNFNVFSFDSNLLSVTHLLKLLETPEDIFTRSNDRAIDRRSSGGKRARGRLDGEELGLLAGGRCEELAELIENSDTTSLGGVTIGGTFGLICEDNFSIRDGEVTFEGERDHLGGREF